MKHDSGQFYDNNESEMRVSLSQPQEAESPASKTKTIWPYGGTVAGLYFFAEISHQQMFVFLAMFTDDWMTEVWSHSSPHRHRLCLSLALYLKVRAGLTMAQTMVRT